MRVVVAERELEFYGGEEVAEGKIRVFAPEKDPRVVDWSCRFEIAWPGHWEGRTVFGADSWKALYSVCIAAPRLIVKTADFTAGRLGISGQRLSTVEQIQELLLS